MNFDDYMEGEGMTPDVAINILKLVEVDFVEISGGSSDKRAKFTISRDATHDFYHKHSLQALVKSGLNKKQPVIVTGGFVKPTVIQEALDMGADLIGFGRQFMRDELFL